MTPEELANRMQVLIEDWGAAHPYSPSIQYAHNTADDILCEALRELGYGTGVDIYESFDKWYE